MFMTNRPLFLSLDGIDGTGKSTQCRLLAEWLAGQGREVVSCVDPGGTPVGQELRQIVLSHKRHLATSCEALLFMASRAQLVDEVIRPALAAGKIVVSDRFLLANVVYQGHAGGLDVDLLWQVGKLSTGGLEPDLTLLLDLPLEIALRRRSARSEDGHKTADRLESRSLAYHERVRQGFLSEARRRPERIHVIDARASVEQVQDALRQDVARFMEG
jgi:dTMP kinase